MAREVHSTALESPRSRGRCQRGGRRHGADGLMAACVASVVSQSAKRSSVASTTSLRAAYRSGRPTVRVRTQQRTSSGLPKAQARMRLLRLRPRPRGVVVVLVLSSASGCGGGPSSDDSSPGEWWPIVRELSDDPSQEDLAVMPILEGLSSRPFSGSDDGPPAQKVLSWRIMRHCSGKARQ